MLLKTIIQEITTAGGIAGVVPNLFYEKPEPIKRAPLQQRRRKKKKKKKKKST